MDKRRIGFVSTRLVGADGVSLKTKKWTEVLEGLGHTCFFLAGDSDLPPDRTRIVPEAHLRHPDILNIYQVAYSQRTRPPALTRCIHQLKDQLKAQLADFVEAFGLELLIAENALAIPMNIPLAGL